ncbi:MAG: methylmalonyl-CoA mutase [Sulfobacillus thermosulfidooxidans]|uniref:Methylmalonyl-CoA mutase n=1 Tax=Sulfobacillus thermotolerans TaxID=338644 RepID=A0ABM6RPR5_9FIRM|nr:methylmalonyl-CoA mutase family protein [Sulfobacillus sp. hq2]AUW93305.1 methylmalonyl-CoA mutase [Sulfobacillus thermotolerans]MCY0907355.1 methylmalonyl-CoA mutase family protein [Sulfobacillus thermotolerans]POB11613.1 methylmalonyl-CoA mutase [Sulfobacillus sp. hq2]PSR36483.1 MAG: methylmalonyl-CoA mutase [Sulfobacillus thermosulfidooxidans]
MATEAFHHHSATLRSAPIGDPYQGHREFRTLSGLPVKEVYGPEDVNISPERPGIYPFTRGIHPTMYRGRVWTMRQFAGFGTARETNERFHYLLEQGQTGLSVAFDMPTLMGYDSDDGHSLGEVGREGVAIDHVGDMQRLFEGIPLDKVSTSMTINGPGPIIWAMYLVAAERQGVAWDQLRGTLQADILKEYIAQKEWIFPPKPSMRVIVDMMAYATAHVPQWNSISISGYHIREAGSTAAQELAFTLADGFAYVEAGIAAGLDVDAFAPRLSFFFNAHIDFFEEIAKFRAARRIWARHLKEIYGAKNPKSWTMRFHTQTAGCSLTAQQPENNIVRTAYEAMAAVLGGTQSLHTNSMDEVLSLPTEKAVKIALRTQQILAYETGVPNTVDPLAGSYYVEALTDQMEQLAEEYFQRIHDQGGVLECIENGFLQREIADAAYRYQKELENHEQIMVGVNAFVEPQEGNVIPLLRIDPAVEREQVQSLQAWKQQRDAAAVRSTLSSLERACATESAPLMPAIIDAVRAGCTEGEIVEVMKSVFGTWRERPVF